MKNQVFETVLEQGWSDNADDNGKNERLPGATIVEVIQAYKLARRTAHDMAAKCAVSDRPPECNKADAAIADATDALGELTLAVSVAEWGVAWDGPAPKDPAGRDWAGPKDITVGKHVMSYALGGLGLPHLDTGMAQDLFDEIAQRIPASANDLKQFRQGFRYDSVRARGGPCSGHSAVIMADLNGEPFRHDAVMWGGQKYCHDHNPTNELDPERWQVLRTWARAGLRDREVQQWIVDYWLRKVWHPTLERLAFEKNVDPTDEAFVVARIWSTSKGAADAAVKTAGAQADPRKRIARELVSYGHERRHQMMQRLGAAYDSIQPGN
ncbi:hypothetical protein QA646_08665 [Rhizobium sp. CB3090]|uniref:hypothetical protein n=1 Tax=Rhizobium sp. CB3090 TaxID=3039156 RepID=UPI0024B06576|nr:hypothetical protein [Rhizobium sp. CB3090]WFU10894.1 hypothetical protein QA646_08665 [Rhizobium sp. CB3090]